MKILLTIAFAFVAVNSQDLGTTESLLSAHSDLRLGHEFFEMNIIVSRDQLSTFVYRDSREFLDSHMDAYASVKNIADETTDSINELPETPGNQDCLNGARNRWQIQVQRFGERLSSCLGVVNRRFVAWDRLLNGIHSTGHLTSNQVQNQGVAVLSDTSDFVGEWTVPRMINRQFRLILAETQPYLNQYTAFLDAVAEGSEEAIIILTECDRRVVEDFTYEAAADLARARNCA